MSCFFGPVPVLFPGPLRFQRRAATFLLPRNCEHKGVGLTTSGFLRPPASKQFIEQVLTGRNEPFGSIL